VPLSCVPLWKSQNFLSFFTSYPLLSFLSFVPCSLYFSNSRALVSFTFFSFPFLIISYFLRQFSPSHIFLCSLLPYSHCPNLFITLKINPPTNTYTVILSDPLPLPPTAICSVLLTAVDTVVLLSQPQQQQQEHYLFQRLSSGARTFAELVHSVVQPCVQ
jgi:hypothetical protein